MDGCRGIWKAGMHGLAGVWGSLMCQSRSTGRLANYLRRSSALALPTGHPALRLSAACPSPFLLLYLICQIRASCLSYPSPPPWMAPPLLAPTLQGAGGDAESAAEAAAVPAAQQV